MMKMKVLIITVMAALLVFTGDALAKGPGSGGGGGVGGGGGGGGDDVGTIPDYGDLIKLYRDEYGVPISSPVVDVKDPETEETVNGGECWQPLLINPDDVGCDMNVYEGESGPYCMVANGDSPLVRVDQYTCGVAVGCSGCTQEVDFGRMNSARAPDSVFESQLADVVVNLATADCVSLDPAGRLVTSRVETVVDEFGEIVVDENGEEVTAVISGAIDSPLQNMAIYKRLMTHGYLGDESNPIALPAGILATAARGLGAASDKGGEVNVDKVAYLNQIMGLDEVSTVLGKRCETYREEVQGTIQEVEKCFLNYSVNPFVPGVPPEPNVVYQYARKGNFQALPDPPYVPSAPGGNGIAGYFEVLMPISPDATFDQTFAIFRGPILDQAFGGNDASGTGSGIGDFAQAADDARAVINYMHSWPLPVDYATQFEECEASGEIAFDVSISAESGLQVPKNIIDGSEGREFFVTLANASGSADPASGTVRLTATVVGGGTLVADLDGNGEFTDTSPFEFPFTDLAVGSSQSFSALFTVTAGTRTTINWTAKADAPGDVNLTNNEQTAISNVRTTSGTGGGEGE